MAPSSQSSPSSSPGLPSLSAVFLRRFMRTPFTAGRGAVPASMLMMSPTPIAPAGVGRSDGVAPAPVALDGLDAASDERAGGLRRLPRASRVVAAGGPCLAT